MIMNRKYVSFCVTFFIIILLCLYLYIMVLEKKENDNKKFEELIEKANEHIEAEDYKNAEKIAKESLKYNKVKGYYYLGALYANYFNDKEKAKEAYMAAYKKKNFEAASMIGFIEEEKGNFKEAEKWYKEGIKSNFEYSFYLIGNFYYNQNDMKNAKKYLEKPAERKSGEAIYILAKIYYKEKNRERIKEYQKQLLERSQLYGVTKDMKKNIEYMLGNKNDNKYFDLVEKANEYIDKEEYKKAEEILLEASKLNKEGYYQIAEMYRHISIEEAMKKYELAYEKGVAKAASNIGSYYYINKDTEKAKIWIQKAIDGGDVNSNFHMGELYDNARDLKKAYEYYSKAANNKNAVAMFSAGEIAFELGEEKLGKYWYNRILTEPGIENLTSQILKNING